MLFFFESGKCARVPMESYATKQNRKKLLKAYSAKEPLAALLYLPQESEAGHPHQRQPSAAGGQRPDCGKGHPRQPGRGRDHL